MTEKFEMKKAKEWLSSMAEKGIYSANAARLRVTAIDQLMSVLGPEEATDVESVLARVDELARRWTTLHNGNPETGQTYRQRTKNGLEAFLTYQKDPTGFRPPPMRVVAMDGGKKSAIKKAVAARPAQLDLDARSQQSQTPASPQPPSSPAMLAYPLGNGRTFQYGLPQDGLAMNDVVRIACFMLTLAKDWTPMTETPAQILAIAKAAANER